MTKNAAPSVEPAAPSATSFVDMPDASSFRRMAASMWSNPSDPTIYGSMDLDVSEALVAIERYRQRTGRRLSITHVVAHAVAQAFRKHPHLNAKVRFWGKLERRTSVDLFVSVATEGGKDLSGARIDRADQLDVAGILDAIEAKAKGIRAGKDKAFEKSRGLFKQAPWFVLRPLLWLIDTLSNELHLHLPSQGMPRDPFGSAVITNVGTFGIDTAFAPFVPMARCPMLLLVTEVKDRPAVVDGKVVARPTLRLCGTFDHRIIDGFSAGVLAREIRALIERPELGEPDASSTSSSSTTTTTTSTARAAPASTTDDAGSVFAPLPVRSSSLPSAPPRPRLSSSSTSQPRQGAQA